MGNNIMIKKSRGFHFGNAKAVQYLKINKCRSKWIFMTLN